MYQGDGVMLPNLFQVGVQICVFGIRFSNHSSINIQRCTYIHVDFFQWKSRDNRLKTSSFADGCKHPQVLLDSERGDKSMEEASFPEMKMMIRKLQNGLIKN